MATPKNRGLGKGLEALFNDVEISFGENSHKSRDDSNRIISIDIHKIKPNTNQPRKLFNEDKIEELARSIEKHGLIQPILVREAEKGFEIVAGERRWRAARKAGLKEIPCILRDLTDEQNMLIALIENLQREDLNPIEEAQGIQRMMESFGLTQDEVSKSVGKSRPYISNALRLLRLPLSIREMVINGDLTSGHARAIAGIKEEEKQIAAAEKCVKLGWPVREIENFAREKGRTTSKERPKSRKKNRDILILEEELKEIFGTKVNIVMGTKKGKIEIEYYSKEEFERLFEIMKTIK
ncbi:MAG: ParB/RepB/Spo0J family partition protein [Tepidanaerobacteraceae bacterium]|nr:ParB/RepB/Spo0J family partition protein [Tepidanaerobacteraceae bacterium]